MLVVGSSPGNKGISCGVCCLCCCIQEPDGAVRIVTIMRYINTVPPHRASTEFFMGMEMGREGWRGSFSHCRLQTVILEERPFPCLSFPNVMCVWRSCLSFTILPYYYPTLVLSLPILVNSHSPS